MVHNLVNFHFLLIFASVIKQKKQWKRHSYMVCRLPETTSPTE